jgi:hypothetical protein
LNQNRITLSKTVSTAYSMNDIGGIASGVLQFGTPRSKSDVFRASMSKGRFLALFGAFSLMLGAILLEIASDAAAQSLDRQRPDAVVAGPIVGGITANNGYYAYGPDYWAGAPLGWSRLFGPAVPIAPGCYLQRQRIWTEYGWRWREAPICY